MEKSTYLIYGIALPIRREEDVEGYWKSWLGDTGRAIWDDDLLPYLEGHDGVACRLLHGEAPVNKAYFGLVLASTHGRHEDSETDVTWIFNEDVRLDEAESEILKLFGRDNFLRTGLLLVDIIR